MATTRIFRVSLASRIFDFKKSFSLNFGFKLKNPKPKNSFLQLIQLIPLVVELKGYLH